MRMLIFGMGYTATRLADRLRSAGWDVSGTGRSGTIAFDDDDTVRREVAAASHILSSVPPSGCDPVLARYGSLIGGCWTGYLSSTGVYGDSAGAWVDETAPVRGRRADRIAADLAWQAKDARVFRLPGIYGPGRSALDRVASGAAHRVDVPGQVFSRVHVDDIVTGVIAGFGAPEGVYNLADDCPCSQNIVIEFAARLMGRDAPPLVDPATLSPMSREFYAENRRVANGKAKRVLGWVPAYPSFAAGLRALRAISRPAMATADPKAASGLQR
jgi:nucleoside-diphosphate-sugar epimerase